MIVRRMSLPSNTNKISIIVPVYNVDKYLMRCLVSLQPYIDAGHELIVVNDGSTDNSQEIIELFCAKNTCVRSIIQENKGLSAARNIGLKYASGDYLWFVDSDDYVGDITVELESLLGALPDVLVFGRTEEYASWKIQVPSNIHDNTYPKGATYLKNSIRDGSFRTNVWDKIFKKTLIDSNNLRFIEGLLYEDMFFIVSALMYSRVVITTCLYPYYYIHYNTSSITKTIRQKDLDVLEFVQLVDSFMASQTSYFNNQSNEYHKLIFNWVSSCLMNKYCWLSLYNLEAKHIFLEIIKNPTFMRSVRYCSNNNVGLRQRFFAILLLTSPTIYKLILSFALKIQYIKHKIQYS